MSDGDWIDEVLNHLQESTIIIDNTGSVLGPKEDARAFQAAKDTAKAAIEQKLNEARIEGIKLVDKALLDNVTGSYPVPAVRNLIKLLIWEYTPADERKALQANEEGK